MSSVEHQGDVEKGHFDGALGNQADPRVGDRDFSWEGKDMWQQSPAERHAAADNYCEADCATFPGLTFGCNSRNAPRRRRLGSQKRPDRRHGARVASSRPLRGGDRRRPGRTGRCRRQQLAEQGLVVPDQARARSVNQPDAGVVHTSDDFTRSIRRSVVGDDDLTDEL